MKCPNCGKEIAYDSQFCEHCGAQMKQTASLVPLQYLLLLSTFLCSIFIIPLTIFYSNSNYSDFSWLSQVIYEWGIIFVAIIGILSLISLIFTIKKKMNWNECFTILFMFGDAIVFSVTPYMQGLYTALLMLITIYYIVSKITTYIINKHRNNKLREL